MWNECMYKNETILKIRGCYDMLQPQCSLAPLRNSDNPFRREAGFVFVSCYSVSVLYVVVDNSKAVEQEQPTRCDQAWTSKFALFYMLLPSCIVHVSPFARVNKEEHVQDFKISSIVQASCHSHQMLQAGWQPDPMIQCKKEVCKVEVCKHTSALRWFPVVGIRLRNKARTFWEPGQFSFGSLVTNKTLNQQHPTLLPLLIQQWRSFHRVLVSHSLAHLA